MDVLDNSNANEHACCVTSSSSDEDHHDIILTDTEELRQELLSKICFSSSVKNRNNSQKKPKEIKKKLDAKPCDKEGQVAAKKEERGPSHPRRRDATDADGERPKRIRSKNSQRRATRWRLQQQQ